MAISDADRLRNQRETIRALQAIVDAQARRLNAAREILKRRSSTPASLHSDPSRGTDDTLTSGGA